MRKYLILFPLILALAGLVIGCGGQSGDEAGDQAAVQSEAGKMVEKAEEAAEAVSGRMKEAETAAEMATYTGTIGCGHCTFHVTGECSPCMKTEDGNVFVIDSKQDHEQLMSDRFSGKELTVTGTVEKTEENMVLHASKVEIH